jgi:hypothetical protein
MEKKLDSGSRIGDSEEKEKMDALASDRSCLVLSYPLSAIR